MVNTVIYERDRNYSFTGKERDSETGFSYFGARYYDSDLSVLFLSVDPLSDKYPSISPYAYCAWNPIRLVDPDGRELYIPNPSGSGYKTAMQDLLSLIKPRYRNLITFDEDGKVGFADGLTQGKIKNDKGLSLIYDMVHSEKKFLYEVSDGEISASTSEGYKQMSDNDHGIVNASNYGLDSMGKHVYQPKEGFDGQVILSESGVWQDGRGNNLRKSVLFHELAENYYRTNFGDNYNVAHEKAILREGISYGNRHPGNFYPEIGMTYTFKGQKAIWR